MVSAFVARVAIGSLFMHPMIHASPISRQGDIIYNSLTGYADQMSIRATFTCSGAPLVFDGGIGISAGLYSPQDQSERDPDRAETDHHPVSMFPPTKRDDKHGHDRRAD